MNNALENRPHLQGLRITDLLAKVAGVNVRDTIKVLFAIDAIVDFLDVHPDEVIKTEHHPTKASAAEATLCNRAYVELERFVAQTDQPLRLKKIKYRVTKVE